MDLPNYFIADLPPEHSVTPQLITEACQALKRNRALYLAGRSTSSIVNLVSAVALSWLEADNPFRALALQRGERETGFSKPTIARGFDAFFKQFSTENLAAVVAQDLGHSERLDRFVADRSCDTLALGRGPELLVHITGGQIPNPAILSIVLGLLVRSAQIVKCARGTSFLPRLFAHSLYEVEPKLASCIEIAEWPGGSEPVEAALFAEADCVTAAGSDATLSAIRRRLPDRVRLVGYGHRVSFAFLCADALTRFDLKPAVAAAARDIAAWDQLGCLSPHVIYVEPGPVAADRFAEMLAQELARVEAEEPRGRITIEEAAAIATQRAVFETRAASSERTRLWKSESSTAWTVVYEADPQFQLSCLNRFVYVKPATLGEALQAAECVRGKVSTVALAAAGDHATELAMQLGRWGVTRICPLGRMQGPPLTWRHDGRPALGDLITWTDWET